MSHLPFPSNRGLKQLVVAFLISSVLPGVAAQAQTPAAATTSAAAPNFRLQNQASYRYDAITSVCDPQSGNTQNCTSNDLVQISSTTNAIGGTVTPQLIDPLGRIVGCAGEVLSDYTGFTIALYETDPSDPTGVNLGRLLSLTPTEVPDNPGNQILEGRSPNTTNSNPFSLTNG
ncbi:MAG: hypothetical protein WCA35_21965, partial [Kovacikia sp.]